MTKRYYHNPRCSKSRQGLELLAQNNIEVEIVEYLKEIPSKSEFKKILSGLTDYGDGIRTKEALYKELGLGQQNLSLDKWASVLSENPKLLERPLLFDGKKSIIGRPTENLLKL